ncbi:Uncharacterised protein [BD1-7 clade bacterium]|uniref:Capsular biosynthesis protein n=1 Tax=BD1-7 clade bacterium TaxID=2029982 RepID=A0A5S9MYP9_9GAMM|nr:Uncharacterised protein [BD1-7 clade bacterium]
MLLITSAAYLDADFSAEFGALPPAFLPVGNRRLFEHQIKHCRLDDEPVFLTIPDDFIINEADQRILDSLDVSVLRVPVGETLGNSVLHALASITEVSPAISILHGDTLIYDLDRRVVNAYAVSYTVDNYTWHRVSKLDADGAIAVIEPLAENDHDPVLSGYFSFADTASLVKSIRAADGDFIQGIAQYALLHRAKPLHTGDWFDFGLMQTYHRSKSNITTQRAFNDLHISPRVVTKTSDKRLKMQNESHWFEQLPMPLRVYTPHWIGPVELNGKPGYQVEYLYLPSLSELFVFGRLPLRSWRNIMGSCEEFLHTASTETPLRHQRPDNRVLYGHKVQLRLQEYCTATELDINRSWMINGTAVPSLSSIAQHCIDTVDLTDSERSCVMHGDFCMSNILYDFRAQVVRVIDPRGSVADCPTIYGDQRYDVAKLCHSAIGHYDLIMAGRYQLMYPEPYSLSFSVLADKHHLQISAFCQSAGIADFDFIDDGICAIMITLFLSMLPLHNDDPARQQALLANALDLYRRFML